MIDFIIRNLDSFIISTIFLILGFLPTMFNPKKDKNSTKSFDNSNVTNRNTSNTHIQNTYSQNISYQNNIQNNYSNTQATVVNSNSSTSSDDPWILFVLSILIIIPLIFFYKYFNKIITYYIAITISSILLSISLIINLEKIKKYSYIPNNVLFISIRNIPAWIFLLVNYTIIYFKVNYSYAMKPFISLIKSFDINKTIENLSTTFKFITNNFYEGSLAIFMAASIACSTILMFKLFKSYIWAIAFIKHSAESNNKAYLKIWNIIYSYLNKQESQPNKFFWIVALLVIFLFSTGAFSYLFKLLA